MRDSNTVLNRSTARHSLLIPFGTRYVFFILIQYKTWNLVSKGINRKMCSIFFIHTRETRLVVFLTYIWEKTKRVSFFCNLYSIFSQWTAWNDPTCEIWVINWWTSIFFFIQVECWVRVQACKTGFSITLKNPPDTFVAQTWLLLGTSNLISGRS